MPSGSGSNSVVESRLPKPLVAGSIPVSRSKPHSSISAEPPQSEANHQNSRSQFRAATVFSAHCDPHEQSRPARAPFCLGAMPQTRTDRNGQNRRS